MKTEVTFPGVAESSLLPPFVRDAVRRIPGMAVVWSAFGVIVGIVSAPGVGPIAVAAGVTAGVIVLTPLGVMLALAGGRCRESLVGGLLGVVLVPLAGAFLPLSGISLPLLGLIFGGIVGATVVGAFYRLPRLILATARGSSPSEVRVEKSVAV